MISSGCGCTAFFVGAALAIAAAAPQLLSGWGERLIERAIEARIDGDVEVYDLELHWKRPQRARRVTLTTRPDENGDTEKVAEFALRFPSLFELLEASSTEWDFKVTDLEVTVRVDADGTSDLGRCLGIDAQDGRSELGVLLSTLGRGVDAKETEDPRTMQTTVLVRKAHFIDMASRAGPDRVEATVSDLAIVATKSRVGYQVKMTDARVEYDVGGEALVSLALNFGGPVGSTHVLQAATVHAEPIPLVTLRLLGIVPRVRASDPSRASSPLDASRGFDSRDAYGSMARGFMEAAESFFREGARIDASYGVPPGTGAGGVRFTLKLDGGAGSFAIEGMHQDGQLLADSTEGVDNAMEGNFHLAPGRLSEFMESLVPPGSIKFEDARPDARWVLRCRSFQLPLAADALTASAFFGDQVVAPAASKDEQQGRRPLGRGMLARQVAALLRRSDATLNLTSGGPDAPALTLWPAGAESRAPADRLDWTHRVTTVVFSGELGAVVHSLWRVEQSSRNLANLSLSIPGAALGPGEDLSPQLDLRVPHVPRALVDSLAALPPELAALLPGRFESLSLQGIRVPQFLAGPVRRPGRGRGSSTPITVKAVLDGSARVEGTYEAGTMTIPRASLSVPLDDVFCEKVLRGYMPWFAGVRPTGSGRGGHSLEIDMRDFVFSMGATEFEQEGELELRPGPVQVKLHSVIATELGASEEELSSQDEEGASGWIDWTPAPIRLSLDGLWVRYGRIELPLSDDYFTTLEGNFDRKSGIYSLSGLVESYFIQGASGGDTLRMVAITGRSAAKGGTATVTFSRGTIDPDITDLMMRKAAEIGEKAK